MPDTKIREELFYLASTEAAPDITETDISTNQTSLWLEGWRWQVPVGVTLVFKPEHYFACYMKTLATAEFTVADKIRIFITDSSRYDRKQILGPANYTECDDFTDAELLRHFDISQPVIAKEDDFIVIEVNAAVSLDASLCYWVMTCNRVRSAIF